MHNTATSSPLVSEKLFNKALKELTETMDDKLTSLTHNINLNTDMFIEASTDTLKTHATNIHSIMSVMAMEFQQSNPRIHNILQTLAATSPDPPHTNVARLPSAPNTSMANIYVGDNNNANHLAPPGFTNNHYRNSPSSFHKCPHQPHE
jgi:hypothetical protein